MEREELLQEVQGVIEADGKQLSRSISEETINAELDDELENIGDDEEANKKVYNRIAKRLLRIDGNIHSNVSREVKEYKAKSQKPNGNGGGKPKDGDTTDTDENETLKLLRGLTERIENIEKSRKEKEDADAKAAATDSIKKSLRAKFKEAKIEVNEYIYKQTLRDLEIPDAEEGNGIDVDELARKMERAYYRNLKEAGLDKKDTAKTHRGGREGNAGETSADRFFNRKKSKEGWGSKKDQ